MTSFMEIMLSELCTVAIGITAFGYLAVARQIIGCRDLSMGIQLYIQQQYICICASLFAYLKIIVIVLVLFTSTSDLTHLNLTLPLRGQVQELHVVVMNSMKLVIPLRSLYWSIHTKDESKRGTAFAFIFGVN